MNLNFETSNRLFAAQSCVNAHVRRDPTMSERRRRKKRGTSVAYLVVRRHSHRSSWSLVQASESADYTPYRPTFLKNKTDCFTIENGAKATFLKSNNLCLSLRGVSCRDVIVSLQKKGRASTFLRILQSTLPYQEVATEFFRPKNKSTSRTPCCI